MGTELKIAAESDAELWDKIVESSLHGTIFHRWKWLKIAEKHTECKLYPLIGFKGANAIGIYPLFYKKRFGIARVFSPPPATAIPYLGPVIGGYESFKQSKKESTYKNFHRSVDDFIFSNLKSNYTLISLIPSLDPRPFKWTNYALSPVFDYNLDLAQGKKKIWQNFDMNLRGHINRTEKSGIYIENGSKEELSGIYDSLVRRYKEQKKVVSVSKDYLIDLYNTFYPDNLKVFAAKQNGNLVGGIVAIFYKGKISFWIGAAKPEIQKVSPNDLAQWEAIKWANEQGLKIYEEIGAGTERLSEFKAKYNPYLTVRFIASKYSSPIYSWLESGYIKVYKPIYAKLIKLYE